jgi:hypothetical protein
MGLSEEATEFMIRGFCAVEGVSQPRMVNSFVIRRKMVESGTSEPAFMRDSAWMPGARKSVFAMSSDWRGFTKRSSSANIVSQQVSRADRSQLREPLEHTLRLSALAHTRSTDQDDTSGFAELHLAMCGCM